MFAKEVHRLRDEYARLRNATNLVPPAGRPLVDMNITVVENVTYYTYWYERDASRCQCIQLADIPNTLSGNILRLRANLPLRDDDYEMVGDDIRSHRNPPQPEPLEDDSDDLTTILTTLPLVEVDADKHFVKEGKYESEVRNLLKCQGDACPGTPGSPHIIQLLGKSSNGKLVFPKFKSRASIMALNDSLTVYKSWILQLIDGLDYLHSLGIIHRDLRIDNLLLSPDGSRLIICDLESRWGNRLAPEVSREPILDAGWTEKSDIYDLGVAIKCMVYANVPITNMMEWSVPHPLDAVVEACTRYIPGKRPNLEEPRVMVERIGSASA